MLIRPMNPRLAQWNALPPALAAAELLPCNGSHAWACGLVERRPIPSAAELQLASNAVWQSLPEPAWLEAFATHPRIGERHSSSASAASLAWSGKEQAAAESDDPTGEEQMFKANQVYEARFGRTFLICATGLTRSQILASLERRMTHSLAEELAEAAEQQRRITCLRLTRWLEGS